jgi:hypothetical protein
MRELSVAALHFFLGKASSVKKNTKKGRFFDPLLHFPHVSFRLFFRLEKKPFLCKNRASENKYVDF